MDGDARKALADSILLGLPGTGDDLTPEQFREMLKRYEGIGDAQLRRNLYDLSLIHIFKVYEGKFDSFSITFDRNLDI